MSEEDERAYWEGRSSALEDKLETALRWTAEKVREIERLRAEVREYEDQAQQVKDAWPAARAEVRRLQTELKKAWDENARLRGDPPAIRMASEDKAIEEEL